MGSEIEVRSWRRVYRLERRIYSIPNGQGQWRLPVPGGIPIWGAVYFAAAALLMLALRAAPGLGVLVSVVPLELAYTVIPAAAAFLGARYRPHGRMPHRHWASRVSELASGKEFYGEQRITRSPLREQLDEAVTLAPGADWPWLCDAEVSGPATVQTLEPVLVHVRRGRREVTAAGEDDHDSTRAVRVEAGERLRIRGGRR
jgi:hypothetical protein